ncbi:MAG TPA: TdeIII family type II restriction endonuclease [Candidatus Aenigmarchaeota archaeon]|nr:TdeIII family type II restriction endonuclease [Candidatus Aenigmarchaeota archaeon]
MTIPTQTATEILETLITTVREKLRKYKPETIHMPFHYRLLGKDRYAMFSFIQSMNTTFGISIWEQVAVILARGAGNYAERQFELLGEIDDDTEKLIRDIHYRLRKGEALANKFQEIEQIRNKVKKGEPKRNPDSVVDLFVKIGNKENYFDITSAKPNMKEFVALKLKLLRWTALRLSQDKNIKVMTRLAIPYNPYHPEPYERWTLQGLYDLNVKEILVGEEFWNFIANGKVHEDLLNIFQKAGEELREEIDRKFGEFRKNN